MENNRPVVLGRVVGAHALRGEIRVRFLGEDPDNLVAASRVTLAADEEGTRARSYEVEATGPGRAGEVRMQLREVTDRNAAEALRGQWLLAEADALRELPEGEWYWHQLIGCRVFGGDDELIGTVSEIWQTGAHDVLVVEGADGRRRLLPAADEFLKEVDIEGGRIAIEVIDGLLDPV